LFNTQNLAPQICDFISQFQEVERSLIRMWKSQLSSTVLV
jgi:hypothetical protein